MTTMTTSELTEAQIDRLLERGYTPRAYMGGSAWDRPSELPSIVSTIAAAACVIVLILAVLAFLLR